MEAEAKVRLVKLPFAANNVPVVVELTNIDEVANRLVEVLFVITPFVAKRLVIKLFVEVELVITPLVENRLVEVALVIIEEVARRVPLRARVLTADL